MADEEEAFEGVFIGSATFSDGKTVDFGPNDVVVLVGPNNSGKSETLRALAGKLAASQTASPVVQAISIKKPAETAGVLRWLEKLARKRPWPGATGLQGYYIMGKQIPETAVNNHWSRADGAIGELASLLCRFINAEGRLQITAPAQNISLIDGNPSHPIQFLQRDDSLEEKVSDKFRRAFGIDLIVHRNAGNTVPLYVGKRPQLDKGEDRISVSYIKKLEALSTLQSQGDGMKSFAGVLLATSVGQESIILVDEPEAFLHPPQARLIGQTLVEDRRHNRQLFIATHSTDVLRGVLNSESPNVRVIRIRREGDVNLVRLLSNERIEQLWGDPLLRHSNIFDGLFHDGVVVCESDSDCRFYAAIADVLRQASESDTKWPDLLFVHCGGKARLSTVVRALREVAVPVQAIADFDILSEEEPLKGLVEALGMNWKSVKRNWGIVKSGVDSKKPELDSEEVKGDIGDILNSVGTTVFPADAKRAIQKVLRRSSPWAHAKSVGKAFVPSGEQSKACEELLEILRNGGLRVVTVGELEGFARTVPDHGPGWVNGVLTRDLAADTELEDARRFVHGVVTWFQ